MDNTCKDKYLEISRTLCHADIHTMNLLEHFIRSRIYNVTNQNSCFVSFRSVLEYFVNVYRDSVV